MGIQRSVISSIPGYSFVLDPPPICREPERRKRATARRAVNYRKGGSIKPLSLDQGLCNNTRLKRHDLHLRRTYTATIADDDDDDETPEGAAHRGGVRVCVSAGELGQP